MANNEFGVQIGANGSYNYFNGTKIPIGNTTLYDNNFINNNQQVQVLVSSATDTWNYGNQGNFWSDYNGADENIDGVGDTPYFVGGTQSDNYPLMTPFSIACINLQLPSWANIALPSPLPTPSFPPQTQPANPTPSPTSSASSVQQSNSQQDSQSQPTQTGNPMPYPSPFIIAAVILVSVAVFGAVFSLALRNRGRNPTQ